MSVESSVLDDNSESGSHQSHDYFPANKLFEYQWPLGDNGAEHYMLQEQVKEYLDIRGIQRKYPGSCVCMCVCLSQCMLLSDCSCSNANAQTHAHTHTHTHTHTQTFIVVLLILMRGNISLEGVWSLRHKATWVITSTSCKVHTQKCIIVLQYSLRQITLAGYVPINFVL